MVDFLDSVHHLQLASDADHDQSLVCRREEELVVISDKLKVKARMFSQIEVGLEGLLCRENDLDVPYSNTKVGKPFDPNTRVADRGQLEYVLSVVDLQRFRADEFVDESQDRLTRTDQRVAGRKSPAA